MAGNLFNLSGDILPDVQAVTSMISEYRRINSISNKPGNFINIDLMPAISSLQGTLFEILMAKARLEKVEYVSLGKFDIIAGRSKTNYRNQFSWEFISWAKLPGSCGNGMGEFSAQYQLDCAEWFSPDKLGVWNPLDEKTFDIEPFHLYSSSSLIDEFVVSIIDGSVETFIKSEHFQEVVEKHKIRARQRRYL